MGWPRFVRTLLASALGLGGAIYAFILVMDPYMNVPFSPALKRAPISTNQRFAYPALARDPAFDSAIVGTSTVRLLDPARLSGLTGARFVNLAMNSATAYEQQRVYDLFVRHHPRARYLVLGLDETWCNRKATIARYTFRAFPEWMYDDDRWNDLLYLFNDKALENAVRMLELQLGRREPKYRPDGYRDFTRDFERFDAATVQRRLYPRGPRRLADRRIEPGPAGSGDNLPLAPRLRAMLERRPPGSRTVLLFPPLHANHVADKVARLSACKGRYYALAGALAGVSIVDYLHISALTRDDGNYFDPLHYRREVADELESAVAAVLTEAPGLAARERPAGQR